VQRLDPGELVELFGDLVVQDQLELDAKKATMDGNDEDGEQQALVRQKLMGKIWFQRLLPSQNAEGYVLIAVYLFIHLFIYIHVISTHNTKSIQPNRLTYGMIGY
jgi:hypothetical protein